MGFKSKEARKEYNQRYWEKHKEDILPGMRTYGASYQQRIKREAFIKYGGEDFKCICCCEKNMIFLSLDHIDGGGNQEVKNGRNRNLSAHLKREGYPKGFQVMCLNCNHAKGAYGSCSRDNHAS